MVFALVYEGQRALFACCIVFAVLPTVSYVLRIVSRHMSGQPLASSDMTMLVGLLFALAVVASNLVCVLVGGMGVHEAEVNQDQMLVFQQALLATQLCWSVSLGFTKSSILLFYMQIFPTKQFRWWAYGTMTFCIAFAAMVFFGTLAICQPFEKNLIPTTPGTCGNRNGFWLAVGITDICSDLTVLILPLPMIWKLKVSTAQKLRLATIFSLGCFVIAVSAIRVSTLLSVDFGGDLTYTVTNTNIWSLLEPTLAVTLGCLPVMAPLARLVRDWFLELIGIPVPRSSHGYNSQKINTFHERERSQFQKLESKRNTVPPNGISTTIEQGSSDSDLESNLGRIHVTTEIELQETRLDENHESFGLAR